MGADGGREARTTVRSAGVAPTDYQPCQKVRDLVLASQFRLLFRAFLFGAARVGLSAQTLRREYGVGASTVTCANFGE